MSQLVNVIEKTVKVYLFVLYGSQENDAEKYANRIAWKYFVDAIGSDDVLVEYLFDTVVKDRIHVARFGTRS